MNPDSECNCCPPAKCDACMPQCSSKNYVRIRGERPENYEFVCSTKNCNIYGGHDTDPMPEYQCHKKRNKVKEENKNSLGTPIGLVVSNLNSKTDGKASVSVQARYATYLKAFARLHLNDEKAWDSLIVDDIIKEGLDLYTTSQKKEINVVSPSDIYLPKEENILREFVLSNFTFHIELMPKFKLNYPASSEARSARGDGVELTLEDFVPALKSFFRHHRYGLITVGLFYIMIWRSSDAYFVFDVCGRRVVDFQADKDKGVVMLMCFRSLINVGHLVVNLSGLQTLDPLMIRELKVVKVITPNGGIMKQDYGTRTHQYEVVNDDYAYLKSELHLTLNRRDVVRTRSGLPVAVAAIVASKIDHPATWDKKMVDKILCFGVHFCQSSWPKCKSREAINVNEFPTYFTLGQFYIIIELMAKKYEGIWRCVPDFKHSELTHAIEKAFNAGHYKMILQVNYQMYAIWKKHDFIYLLDPYRHRILGKQNEPEVYEEMEKSATVRMFRSFEVFMNVLNNILLDSNRTSQFYIHILKIKNIQDQHKARQANARPIEEPKLDSNDEVLSINEHICFEEAEDLCHEALGEVSDYEDEDLKSDVVEIELKTSSSEAEDLMEEEEEEGPGELEEIEILESSSSGEEGAGHKKPAQSGKGGGKGGKTNARKYKGGKKGDKKTKKEQGANDSKENADAENTKKVENIDEYENTRIMKRKRNKNKRRDKTRVIDENTTKDTTQSDNLVEETKKKDESEKGNKKLNQEKVTDSKDKENSKGDKNIKDSPKNDNGLSKTKDLSKVPSKDENISNVKDISEDNDLYKDKDLSLDKSKEEELNRDKEPQEENVLNEDLSKDKRSSKDKENDNTSINEQKNEADFDKVNNKDAKEFKNEESKGDKDLNQPVDVESKPAQEKNEGDKENEITQDINKIKNKDEENGSNKENEISKDSNKIIETDMNKDDAKDTENIKDDKTIDSNITITDKNHLRKSQIYNDGTEADDENEDNFKRKQHYCSIPNPNCYPGYFKCPVDMAVIGSESGSYESICKLFHAGFKVADRLLTMTPWGNFVIFLCSGETNAEDKLYFLFDGCTCNFDRFRHLDLSAGTAGLICFEHMHNVIEYIRHLRKSRRHYQNEQENTADDICKEYCTRNFNLRL